MQDQRAYRTNQRPRCRAPSWITNRNACRRSRLSRSIASRLSDDRRHANKCVGFVANFVAGIQDVRRHIALSNKGWLSHISAPLHSENYHNRPTRPCALDISRPASQPASRSVVRSVGLLRPVAALLPGGEERPSFVAAVDDQRT